jgi:hypothetical protein
MNDFRAKFGGRPFVPVMSPWLLRLAAPILLVITLPIAAFVFAIALGAAGALVASRAISRFFSAAAPRPAAAGVGPIIEGEYEVVAERRRPAFFNMPR